MGIHNMSAKDVLSYITVGVLDFMGIHNVLKIIFGHGMTVGVLDFIGIHNRMRMADETEKLLEYLICGYSQRVKLLVILFLWEYTTK